MVTVNGLCICGMGGGGSGNGEMIVQSVGGMGKHFLQPFRENIDRRSCNDGSQELIPVLHQKC